MLVGTITIEKSEMLSKMLKQRASSTKCSMPNTTKKKPRSSRRRAARWAVTIATNMAGRGTDILLGGNAEFMAKAEMRKQGFDEEMLVEATAYSHTDNEEILKARETFAALNQKYKKEIAPEAEEVKNWAASTSSARSAMNPAGLTTSCAAAPAVRVTPE